jgi:hypothetical protein
MKTSKKETSKFVVGKLYTDESGEVLRFIGKDNDGDPLFTHHSGNEFYSVTNGGTVPFSDGCSFYTVISL